MGWHLLVTHERLALQRYVVEKRAEVRDVGYDGDVFVFHFGANHEQLSRFGVVELDGGQRFERPSRTCWGWHWRRTSWRP